jgi:uncharacterized iron-regulated membrane protein
MHKTLRMCHLGWLSVAVAAACLSACGSGNQSGADAGLLHGKPAKVRHASAKVVDPTAGMSTAVSLMKGPAPVSLKFQLGGRPQPGQPVNVDFALIPDASVVSLSGKFAGDDGLKLSNGEQMDAVNKPAASVPLRHTVTVVPSQDGIYTVTVSLMVTVAGDEARLRTFAVPIIAGDGLPHLAAHTDSAPARH